MRILQLLEDPFGGHVFDDSDDLEYTVCANCYGRVSFWEINEGLWPARLGRYCPAILLQAPSKETSSGYQRDA